MKRRRFLPLAGLAAVSVPARAQDPDEPVAVAIIGHTGRGDYGHGLDTVWLRVPGVRIVGVADPDADGLQRAVRRLRTSRGFRDYRRMLKEVAPAFVSICPRYVDQHAEMILACAADGRVERVFPYLGAQLATLGYLFPALRRLLKPYMSRKGRRAKDRLRAERLDA